MDRARPAFPAALFIVRICSFLFNLVRSESNLETVAFERTAQGCCSSREEEDADFNDT